MKKITSTDNKTFKMCKQLENRKYRDKLGMYIIEGPNLVEEALKNKVRPEFAVINETVKEQEELKALAEKLRAEDSGFYQNNIFVLEDKLFKKLVQTEQSQGIFAAVEKKSFSEEQFFFNKERTSGNIVILDRLQDPGNVGTIIRTADAAGYSGILVMKGTVDIYSPKVVRACTGSLFRIPVMFADTPLEALRLLKAKGKKVVGTGFETDKYYYETDLSRNIALIIGNEGNGICEEFLKGADEVVKIPMEGSVESLNASIAAGILMYEAVRKSGGSKTG